MEKVEGNMKIMRAENDSALSKNEAAIAGLRTDMERLRTTIFIQIISVATLVVTAVGVLIGYLQYFK